MSAFLKSRTCFLLPALYKQEAANALNQENTLYTPVNHHIDADHTVDYNNTTILTYENNWRKRFWKEGYYAKKYSNRLMTGNRAAPISDIWATNMFPETNRHIQLDRTMKSKSPQKHNQPDIASPPIVNNPSL